MLNVGYISNRAWADINNGEYVSPEPDKYMKITLRERNGDTYISSIQAADNQEIAKQLKTTAGTVTQPVTQESTLPEQEDITDPITQEEPTDEAEIPTDENGETQTGETDESESVSGSETQPEITSSFYG